MFARLTLVLSCLWTRVETAPLRVLPLGDSLTFGCGDQCDPLGDCMAPPAFRHHAISSLGQDGHKGSHYHPGQSSGYGAVPCSRCSGGYRCKLLQRLWFEGRDVEFVGNLENDDGCGRHEGHVGWRIDQIEGAIDFSGGIGLGRDGEGGHDAGRKAVPLAATGQNFGPPGAPAERDYSSQDGGAGWARLQPDVILLHAGSNDIGQGAEVDTVINRTRSLLGSIFKALPRVHVFHASLISMLPYGPVQPNALAVVTQFNTVLPGLLAEHVRLHRTHLRCVCFLCVHRV